MRVNCIVVVVEGLFVEGEVSGLDSRVDRMESGGEIGEHCPFLYIAGCHHDLQPRAWAVYQKRKQTLRQKRKAVASMRREGGGGCLVPEREPSQNGRLKGIEAIELLITCLH
jgi:hypothetical protein